jgi:hypothetical protein
MNKKLALALCLTALVIVAARGTVAPVWDTCPGPAFDSGLSVVHACVYQVRECPDAYNRYGAPLNVNHQCWVWFPGDHNEAPHWWLADR